MTRHLQIKFPIQVNIQYVMDYGRIAQTAMCILLVTHLLNAYQCM